MDRGYIMFLILLYFVANLGLITLWSVDAATGSNFAVLVVAYGGYEIRYLRILGYQNAGVQCSG